eukprot:2154556-Amphidinium_carterae.2
MILVQHEQIEVGPIGGGVQEVVDFHNREIGQFTYGAGVVGTSSLGVGVGGYAGIGWKGFKQNWTLESAFVSELSITKGISVFGLPVGGTMRASIDADTTGPGPWVPEPNAIVSILAKCLLLPEQKRFRPGTLKQCVVTVENGDA